ncbi:hypothetical protein BO78DRAFT_394722 [Aspergillus sclerotiicarbonarius CBS 121057]|uniref:CBM-cenC domain-containing protein n=1 Tax=Aspergillus sclerotiicarbonarius (strain CBS 121057 / IBT 28362) TaxID=1448318 RepID=A0A319EHP2_ASPSB|nr:hypothetical protein BO78DRAFT_394722 [Aspergillus sclerotiicarbonarius CBS 121057]
MLLPTTLVLTSWILLPLSAAETTVITGTTESCTTTAEFLTNPSFDTGTLNPWEVLTGYGSVSVVQDTAYDRGYVANLAEGYTLSAVYQTVTGLTVGASYTLSYDYMIDSAARSGTAAFYLCVDGVASANRLTDKVVSYTTAGTSWETLSTTFTPTSDTHEFYIFVYVITASTDPDILLDNAQFLAASEDDYLETCTTSTYTSTSTIAISTSGSAAISSPVPIRSSSVIATVSSVIPTSTPSQFSVVNAAPSNTLKSPIPSSGSVITNTPLVSVSSNSRVIQSSPSSKASSSSSLVPSAHPSSSAIPSSAGTPSTALSSSSLQAVSPSTASSTVVIRSSSAAPISAPPAVSTPGSEPEEVVTVVSTVYTTSIATVLECPAS